jgi:GNAT superfamily N-acetyltransferase
MSSDEPGLREVDPLARRGDVERIAFLREAVARGRCLIAETGSIVGFIVSTPRHFFARDFIELLMVRDDVRRLGVGQALLRAAVERAGTSRVFSSANASNTVMQSVFEAGGWTLSGQLDGLDEHDPELVYFIDQQHIAAALLGGQRLSDPPICSTCMTRSALSSFRHRQRHAVNRC